MTDPRRSGRAAELRCAALFLLEDWDVALPMVETGADLVVSKEGRVLRVECKGRFAGQSLTVDVPWKGHPAPDLVYLDAGGEWWWVVPWKAYTRAAGKPQLGGVGKEPYRFYSVTQKKAKESFGRFLREKGLRRL
jgi:hypothetical protein